MKFTQILVLALILAVAFFSAAEARQQVGRPVRGPRRHLPPRSPKSDDTDESDGDADGEDASEEASSEEEVSEEASASTEEDSASDDDCEEAPAFDLEQLCEDVQEWINNNADADVEEIGECADADALIAAKSQMHPEDGCYLDWPAHAEEESESESDTNEEEESEEASDDESLIQKNTATKKAVRMCRDEFVSRLEAVLRCEFETKSFCHSHDNAGFTDPHFHTIHHDGSADSGSE